MNRYVDYLQRELYQFIAKLKPKMPRSSLLAVVRMRLSLHIL